MTRWKRQAARRLLLCFAITSVLALGAQTNDISKSPREQQALDQGQQLEQQHKFAFAIDAYKKANKIEGGKCVVCLSHLCNLYRQTGDNKRAAESAAQLEQLVTLPADKATAAMLQGTALLREATQTDKRKFFEQADVQFQQALRYQPNIAQALFLDGLALGRMGNDAAAKAAFSRYVTSGQADPILQARARRYVSDPALTREKLAPAFAIRTMQGKLLSLDNLQGQVVLLDFWATWNDASKNELPAIKKIVEQFQEQPLVVVSVSLDTDQTKWQDYVAAHNMTWPQYWDKGAAMATTFGIHALPQYMLMNAQGVLGPTDLAPGNGLVGSIKKMLTDTRRMQKQPAEKQPFSSR